MIALTKIEISGFKSSDKTVSVVFSEKQSSVIYGNNGCGKTTFLKLLHSIFTQDDAALLEENVSLITVDFKYQSVTTNDVNAWEYKQICIPRVTEVIEFEDVDTNTSQLSFIEPSTYRKNLTEQQVHYHFNWSYFLESRLAKCRSLSLGVDRGNQSTRLNVNAKIISQFLSQRSDIRSSFKSYYQLTEFSEGLVAFLKRRAGMGNRSTNSLDFSADHLFLKEVNMDNVESTLLERYRVARRNATRKIQNALFDTLASAITSQDEITSSSPIPENFNEIIHNNKELLMEALDDKSDNSFKNKIIDNLAKIKTEQDVETLKANLLLSKLLIEMSEQLKDSETELSAINTVIEKFDLFMDGDKKLIITANSIKVKIGNKSHSISKLSSGERHILTLFTLLLDQGRNRNFIIIDEPEISLNSLWQEALLPTLQELLPKCQIIVASHSPILAESVDNLAELKVSFNGSIDNDNDDDDDASSDDSEISFL
jgi:ABC-type lipoprotein export system ATPase subunit